MRQRRYIYFIERILVWSILFIISAPLVALIFEVSTNNSSLNVVWLNFIDWKLFFNTLLFSLGVISVTLLIALPVAFILSTVQGYKGKLFSLFLISPITIPSYLYALTWQQILQLLGLPTDGVFIAFFIEVLARLPLLIMAALIGLASIPISLHEAGKIFANPVLYFIKIIIPLIKNYLFVGVSISLLLSINDYALPSIFMRHTYTLEIFARYSATGKGYESFLFALPLILISLLLSSRILYTIPRLSNSIYSNIGYIVAFTGPIGFDIYKAFGLLIAVLQFTVPIVAVSILVINSPDIILTISDIESLQFSLLITLLSIFCVFPLAWFMAEYLYKYRSHFIWMVILLLFALPSSMIGSGTILFWSWIGIEFIYGYWPLLLFGYIVKLFPIFTLLIYVAIRGSDRELWNAASLYRCDMVGLWLRVRLFLIWPGIAVAFLFGLSMTLSEIVLSLLLSPAGSTSIGVRLFNYLHYGAVNQVAYLILFVILITLVFGGVLYMLLMHKSRK